MFKEHIGVQNEGPQRS